MARKAKSLWYTAPRKLEIREVAIADPGPKQVLVRVLACGVCTWDLYIYSGGFQNVKPYPFCFGHEGVGVVEKVGPEVTRVAPGARVALRESAVIGAPGSGHMAEYALQAEAEVIPLPQDSRPVEHWMVEPVACCVNAVDLARIRCGAKVALVGCGFMGSILLQLIARSPVSRVAVFDVRPESLEYARSLAQAGPIEVYDLNSARNVEELHGGWDVVFESAAVEAAFRLSNRLVRKGGTLVIFSWQHQPFTFDFGDWHVRGITVINASPAAAADFTRCFYQSVPLLQSGQVDLSPLVTHVAAPEEAAALYRDGIDKCNGYIKGVLRWGS